MKDTLERVRYPNLNMREYLKNAYMHPVLKGDDSGDTYSLDSPRLEDDVRVQTRRQSRRNTPLTSKQSNSATPPPSLSEAIDEYAEFP